MIWKLSVQQAQRRIQGGSRTYYQCLTLKFLHRQYCTSCFSDFFYHFISIMFLISHVRVVYQKNKIQTEHFVAACISLSLTVKTLYEFRKVMNQRLGPNKKFLNSPLRFKKEGLIAILSQSPSSPSQYPQLSPRLEFLVTEAVK